MITRKTLFAQEERLAVEDKYAGDIVYDALAGTCRRIMIGAGAVFKLHPTELFYQVFYLIDEFREADYDWQLAYSAHEVWYDLLDYLRDDKGVDATDDDMNLCISTICWATAEVLGRSGMQELGPVAEKLLQAAYHVGIPLRVNMEREFRHGFSGSDADAIACYMRSYWHGSSSYTDEINKLLDGLALNAEPQDKQPLHPLSSVTIAKDKKTSVLVVLNAMYKAGWFVGNDGNKLRNRDNALNEIMANAFGMPKTTGISQTIKPSNNMNEGKNELLMKRLLDEDEISEFIRSLKDELLRNVK